MPGSHPNPGRPTGPVLVTGASGTIGRRLVPALVAAGHQVRAMTRSDAAAQTAAAAGAEPVHGDVTDPASLSAAVRGCQVVIHAAGRMGASPAVEPFWPVNVTGTRNMLAAAAEAQVRRFIYLGAAMSLLGSPRPVTGADESWPLQQPRCSGYAASKTRADQAVQAANGTQMATVVIRPGWVWGTADDPSTASFVQAVRAGHLRLIDGGRHRIVATHIDNLIHAVGLAIDHGAGGCGYYVFDDGSTTVRDFLAGLLQAHGLTLPEASIPGPVAAGVARALDVGWRITRRPGDPPITRMIVELNRRPFLISDARARQELRYQPVITRQQGIQRLRNAIRATVQPANPRPFQDHDVSPGMVKRLVDVAGGFAGGRAVRPGGVRQWRGSESGRSAVPRPREPAAHRVSKLRGAAFTSSDGTGAGEERSDEQDRRYQ